MTSLRWLLLIVGGVCVVAGVLVWNNTAWLGAPLTIIGGGCLVAVVGLGMLQASRGGSDDAGDDEEPTRVEDLTETRRNELIRGTSMHLRDMRYRYSIRYDRSERAAFTTEVNSVTLGFVPVVILDNRSDKQGYGYVAFPYDGNRWRGPGLPCGGDPSQAVAHASRCVAPLEDVDEDGD